MLKNLCTFHHDAINKYASQMNVDWRKTNEHIVSESHLIFTSECPHLSCLSGLHGDSDS